MHKKKVICFLLAAVMLVFAVVLPSCRKDTSPAGEKTEVEKTDAPYYTFTDSVGNTVTLPEAPKKVAVLFSSFADIWLTAGGEIAVTVGESVQRGFANDSVLLVDSGAGKTIDTELLLSYEPDFVLCSADLEGQVKAAELLNDSGIPTAQFRVESFEDYLAMLKICTDITQNAEAYQTHGVDLQKEIDAIRKERSEKTDTEDSVPRILFIRAGSGYSATKAKTAQDNFVCRMLAELGSYNIAENAPVLLDGLSIEEVLVNDPDYIFISTMGDEDAAKAYMESVFSEETWQHLTAVKEGKYCYLPKAMFQYKPNAKWAESYAYLAEILDSVTVNE